MSERREIVSTLVEKGISERMACQVVGLNRSTYRYKGYGLEGSEELKARIMELAGKHRRYGYRRITAVLRRSERVNHKRVWRLWKSEGLSLPRRRPKKRQNGQRWVLPTRAEYRGHVWTLDVVYDRTETNRVLIPRLRGALTGRRCAR